MAVSTVFLQALGSLWDRRKPAPARKNASGRWHKSDTNNFFHVPSSVPCLTPKKPVLMKYPPEFMVGELRAVYPKKRTSFLPRDCVCQHRIPCALRHGRPTEGTQASQEAQPGYPAPPKGQEHRAGPFRVTLAQTSPVLFAANPAGSFQWTLKYHQGAGGSDC